MEKQVKTINNPLFCPKMPSILPPISPTLPPMKMRTVWDGVTQYVVYGVVVLLLLQFLCRCTFP